MEDDFGDVFAGTGGTATKEDNEQKKSATDADDMFGALYGDQALAEADAAGDDEAADGDDAELLRLRAKRMAAAGLDDDENDYDNSVSSSSDDDGVELVLKQDASAKVADGATLAGTATGGAEGGDGANASKLNLSLDLRSADARAVAAAGAAGLTTGPSVQTSTTGMSALGDLQVLNAPAFNAELDQTPDPPWRRPGIDLSDYFNYGFDERSWRLYAAKQIQLRLQLQHKGSIATFESGGGGGGAPGNSRPQGGGGPGRGRPGGREDRSLPVRDRDRERSHPPPDRPDDRHRPGAGGSMRPPPGVPPRDSRRNEEFARPPSRDRHPSEPRRRSRDRSMSRDRSERPRDYEPRDRRGARPRGADRGGNRRRRSPSPPGARKRRR